MGQTLEQATSCVGRPLPLVASEINATHLVVLSATRSVLDHAKVAGDLLWEAKEHPDLHHGQWLPWLAEHCPLISVRTAQGYMRIARHWSELQRVPNAQKIARLGKALKFLRTARRHSAVADVPCGDYCCPRCNFEWSGEPRPLKPELQRELRRILEEMTTFPFQRRTFNYDTVGRGGSPEVVGGAGGAPVFHDIVDGSNATRMQVARAILRVLQGRKPTALGARALDVARRRNEGDSRLAPAWLPPDAGISPQEQVRLASDGELEAVG